MSVVPASYLPFAGNEAAFDYEKEPEVKTASQPDTATAARPVEGQDSLPFEVKIPGDPAETEEPEEEEDLQPTEGQLRPSAPRSSHRKRIYK